MPSWRPAARILLFLAFGSVAALTLGNAWLGPWRVSPDDYARLPGWRRSLCWHVAVRGTLSRGYDVARTDRRGHVVVRRLDRNVAPLQTTGGRIAVAWPAMLLTRPPGVHEFRGRLAPMDGPMAAALRDRWQGPLPWVLDETRTPSVAGGLLALAGALAALGALLRRTPAPPAGEAIRSLRAPRRSALALGLLTAAGGGTLAWALVPDPGLPALLFGLAGAAVASAREVYLLTAEALLVDGVGGTAVQPLSEIRWLHVEDRLDGVRRLGVVHGARRVLELELAGAEAEDFWQELCLRAQHSALGGGPAMDAAFLAAPPERWEQLAGTTRRMG